MRIVINENERGLLFKDGRFVKVLDAGKHPFFGTVQVEVLKLDQSIASKSCSLEILLQNDTLAAQAAIIDVADWQMALHFVDGRFSGILRQGKYAFWSAFAKHEFKLIDISTPEVGDDVPAYLFGKIAPVYFQKFDVAEYQRGRLFFNQKLIRILEPGTYFFWKTDVKVEVGYVDIRLTQMDITGQEILTFDKVALRISFVCNYRITDYVRILNEIDNFKEQLHVAAQLALRDYVGKYRIDEILENKDQLSQYVFDRLKKKEKDLFVEINDAGVKDIILPGEIRDIMNTVLIAEKRAQANVITRREEVASTRSLLNTAKLMDENQTLYKLKELEFVERICENVGNINLNGNGDALSQLTSILHSSTT